MFQSADEYARMEIRFPSICCVYMYDVESLHLMTEYIVA